MSKHRAQVRPRWGRIAVLASSMAVTGVAVLASLGFVPSEGGGTSTAAAIDAAAADTRPSASSRPAASAPDGPGATAGATADPTPEPTAEPTSESPVESPVEPPVEPLPAGSGQGRRVVFSEGDQRVWLVADRGRVQRSYLVSGSVYDNLDPGTYEVYSRSEHAIGVDDSGTMNLFVRFTQGENAAIGFHDIPVDDGKRVQGVEALGTPTSHGCIRQRHADAKALWDFAPIGTTVVVTA